MSLARLDAIRYATPLKEGGSLPAIVETAQDGLFVVKFLGAGQGAKALIAEIIVGELAHKIGLPAPDLALIDIDASFGRTERDPEIRDLLKASTGVNVGLRFMEGALNYDPIAAADLVTAAFAADLVWLDAFVTNIDRTARNPNLMVHKNSVVLIDHGAALYFHHSWDHVSEKSARSAFPAIANHVLLPLAESLEEADARLANQITPSVLVDILELVPDSLLLHAPAGVQPAFAEAAAARQAYVNTLTHRLSERAFVTTAEAARLKVVTT